MRKIFAIARQEFVRHVLRKRFLMVLLSPVLMLVGIGAVLTVVITSSQESNGTLGYVDPAGVLRGAQAPATGGVGAIQPFADEPAARTALEAKTITAYYVLAADYMQTGSAALRYWQREPSADQRNAFRNLAQTALLRDAAPALRVRAIDGAKIRQETPASSRVFDPSSPIGFVLPLLMGVLFFVVMLVGVQYLMTAVVEEKENRTIEVLVSTVTPTQLLSGKVIGIVSVALLQLLVWLSAAALGLAFASERFPSLGLSDAIEPWFVAVLLLLFVMQLLAYSALFGALGSLVNDAKGGQSISGPLVLLAISPEFFLPALLLDPNGPVAVALTLFPFTAPFTAALRYGVTVIPAWQLGVAAVGLAITTVGCFWFAGRMFHFGLLRFSGKVPWSDVFRSVFASRKPQQVRS